MTTKAARPLTTAQKLYVEICKNDKYSEIRWIANVFMTCAKPGKRLKALVDLVDGGHEVSPIGFVMPYEGLIVDGSALVAGPLLDRGEKIPYGSDWYKH